ncbi:MAG: hypothetical protein QXV17_06435 [Candidatus Micrarchaeaceae archaeon]
MGKEDNILDVVLSKRHINLDTSEDTSFTKPVFYIFGDKGVGKTTAALTLPGTHGVISLDRKSKRIKDQLVLRDPTAAQRIHIYDGVRYMTGNRDTLTEDAFVTLKYIVKLLNDMPPVDWVTIDATEVLLNICELVMRYVNKLEPFAGFKELSLWKQRNAYVKEIHRLAYSKARIGPIYTAYSVTASRLTEKGLEVTDEVPRWVDEIKYESDIVIKITQRLHGDNKTASQFATIVSSKIDTMLKTGDVIDISNYKPFLTQAQINENILKVSTPAAQPPLVNSTLSEPAPSDLTSSPASSSDSYDFNI